MSFQNFFVEHLENESKFKQPFCEINITYKKGINQNNKSQFLSFYLMHLLTHNQEFEELNQYITNLEISSPIAEEYLISSKFYRGSATFSTTGTGRGAIFRLDEGLEVFYQEKNENNQSRKIHYQYILTELNNDNPLLKVVNCENGEVTDCFVVEKNFNIEDADYLKLKDNNFKEIAKLK